MVRFGRYKDAKGDIAYGIAHADGSMTVAEGCPFAGTLRDTGCKADVKSFCSPIQPSSIVCIGLNYKGHADELGLPYPKNPVVFYKPLSSAAGHRAKVVKPRITEKMDYEVELTIVIGKACKDVTEDQALEYVLGYTVANDLSTRDWQKVPELGGSQWCRSKGFDGFSPLGPVLVTREEIPNPNNLQLRTFVNGQKRQDSNTSDLIFNIQQIITFLSCGSTILPGTVIMTGTPAGVAEGKNIQPKPGMDWLKPGDKVVTDIENIGALDIEIVADPSTSDCFTVLPSKI
jgi:2-keto-4-pentenoate hydratase/2-oxohepta-3-ene-1,7-dioic acid hydratase in catechol pathway